MKGQVLGYRIGWKGTRPRSVWRRSFGRFYGVNPSGGENRLQDTGVESLEDGSLSFKKGLTGNGRELSGEKGPVTSGVSGDV